MYAGNNVCKHNQTGFCKFRQDCKKYHVNEICPNIEICKDTKCTLRHPKTCQTFEVLGKCKFANCAYRHLSNSTNQKVECLEKVVEELMVEIVKLGQSIKKDDNQKIEVLDRDLKALICDINQLTNYIKNIELLLKRRMRKRLCRLMTKKDTIEESKNPILKGSSSDKEKVNFQCHHCDFECENKVTLNKHTNTKHALNESDKEFAVSYNKSECSLCDDNFQSAAEFRSHIKDHMEEIENMDIASLTNGHDLFECNLCSFESGCGDSVKEHLINHVNQSKEDQNSYLEEEVMHKKRLIDEYDVTGTILGNDRRFMDSESDTENNE